MKRPAVLFAIALSCGGTISDFPPPDPNAVAYDSRVAPLLEVPGGETRIGFWDVGVNHDLAPTDCALPANEIDGTIVTQDNPVNVEVVVATFQLMATEVSNRAYALCVDAGACNPPDVPLEDAQRNPIDWRSPDAAERPVLVSWDLAYAFCRHYGGNLPTAGEFSRAASGDAMAYSVPGMLTEWPACVAGSADAECARFQFNTAGAGWTTLLAVGTDTTDVGPYGHHDLFGNAADWIRGEPVIPNALSCTTFAEHDLALEPRQWNGDPTSLPIAGIDMSDLDVQIAPQYRESSSYPAWPIGFRCAFPAN